MKTHFDLRKEDRITVQRESEHFDLTLGELLKWVEWNAMPSASYECGKGLEAMEVHVSESFLAGDTLTVELRRTDNVILSNSVVLP